MKKSKITVQKCIVLTFYFIIIFLLESFSYFIFW